MFQIRRIILTILAGTAIGLLYFTYLFYSESGSMPEYGFYWKELVASLVSANLAAFGINGLRRLLNRWIPWQHAITFRFIVGVVLSSLLALLIFGAVICAYFMLSKTVAAVHQLFPAFTDAAIKLVILTVATVFIYSIIDFTLYSYAAYAEVQIESVRLTQAQLALQLQMLKNQLSPHYLFNSLNTISSLIYRNPQQAEKFIRKLSQTYQYILATQNKPLVTIAEELDFLNAYIFLLKARFEGALEVDVALPAHIMNSKIPPLTLQLLIENAVKHNVISDEVPLLISLYVDMNDWITVSNTIQKNTRPVDSFKIGLDNIEKRYQYQTNRKIEVIRDDRFTVKLPILTS